MLQFTLVLNSKKDVIRQLSEQVSDAEAKAESLMRQLAAAQVHEDADLATTEEEEGKDEEGYREENPTFISQGGGSRRGFEEDEIDRGMVQGQSGRTSDAVDCLNANQDDLRASAVATVGPQGGYEQVSGLNSHIIASHRHPASSQQLSGCGIMHACTSPKHTCIQW